MNYQTIVVGCLSGAIAGLGLIGAWYTAIWLWAHPIALIIVTVCAVAGGILFALINTHEEEYRPGHPRLD